jgi:hypothetical protein
MVLKVLKVLNLSGARKRGFFTGGNAPAARRG